ncbi:MAG: hypothetical protein GX977_10210 [Firmicutes bacterium]|nr:hypothetical protein [Bacillota bacterium]
MMRLSGFGDEISPNLEEQLQVLEQEGILLEGIAVQSFFEKQAWHLELSLEILRSPMDRR